MNQKAILLVAIGLGAYMLLQRQGASYRVPGTTPGGGMRYPSAPNPMAATEAAAYRDVGSLIGNIYRRVAGGGSSSAPAVVPPTLPDDSVVGNPPGMTDPWTWEMGTWGIDPSQINGF